MTKEYIFSISTDNRLYLNDKIVVLNGKSEYFIQKEKEKILEFITVDNDNRVSINLLKINNISILKEEEFKSEIFELIEN